MSFLDVLVHKLSQDAGGLKPSRAGADFTRLSSRDLYGAGSRLHSMADDFEALGLVAAARHYRTLAAIEDAGMGPKTGQSTPQSTIHEVRP